MKKIILLLMSIIISANLFGCYGEIEDIAILFDEADTIISESTGESSEPENVTDLKLSESCADDESTSDGEQISELEDISYVDKMFTDAEQILDDDISSIYGEDEIEVIEVTDESEIPSTDEFTLNIDGTYTTADDVALYIYLYDDLPDNFITKNEARELGWTGGGLDDYAPGMCIGGDYFGNREGLLPKAKGRTYTECDINTLGEDSRGAERIVFSNDGLIYYTDDHYESFVLLYDEDGKAA